VKGRFPSILAKTLPPTTMGSGWKGTGALTDYISIIDCLGNRDVFEEIGVRARHSTSRDQTLLMLARVKLEYGLQIKYFKRINSNARMSNVEL